MNELIIKRGFNSDEVMRGIICGIASAYKHPGQLDDFLDLANEVYEEVKKYYGRNQLN